MLLLLCVAEDVDGGGCSALCCGVLRPLFIGLEPGKPSLVLFEVVVVFVLFFSNAVAVVAVVPTRDKTDTIGGRVTTVATCDHVDLSTSVSDSVISSVAPTYIDDVVVMFAVVNSDGCVVNVLPKYAECILLLSSLLRTDTESLLVVEKLVLLLLPLLLSPCSGMSGLLSPFGCCCCCCDTISSATTGKAMFKSKLT